MPKDLLFTASTLDNHQCTINDNYCNLGRSIAKYKELCSSNGHLGFLTDIEFVQVFDCHQAATKLLQFCESKNTLERSEFNGRISSGKIVGDYHTLTNAAL